jgi:hypothetical protein
MKRASAVRQSLKFTSRKLDHDHWIFESRFGVQLEQDAEFAGDDDAAKSLQSRSLQAVGSRSTPKPATQEWQLPIGSTADCLCPSFSPKAFDVGAIFAVVVGEVAAPRVVFLHDPIPLSEEIFRLVAPFHPSEVFRITGTCVRERCKNFGDEFCHLGKAAADELRSLSGYSACSIRGSCRWWLQEGRSACEGCSGVVTISKETIRTASKETN